MVFQITDNKRVTKMKKIRVLPSTFDIIVGYYYVHIERGCTPKGASSSMIITRFAQLGYKSVVIGYDR